MPDFHKPVIKIPKKILLFAAVFALFGCATVGRPSEYSMITLPGRNNLVILGASGRQLRHTDEIAIAREEAALKASMYHGFTASAVELFSAGPGYLDYMHESYSWVDYNQPAEYYMERLTFDEAKDVFRDRNGNVFIRFSYPAAFPANINYRFERNPDGRPVWTIRPPSEIAGFVAGVGHSGRLVRFSDTFRASYEAAAVAITSRVSTYIGEDNVSVQDRAGTQIYRRSVGNLTQFLVLETWIDPQTRGVYTLAIARPVD